MHPPKCDNLDYIQFLIAAQRVYTCTEAARCQPADQEAPAHDAFTRLLARQPPDTEALWQEVKAVIQPQRGLLVLEDSTLDKPYARRIELVSRHWSGKHRRVVCGINLVTLLWTDGNAGIPCDCRVYHKPTDGQTKNEHFRAMLARAKERGFTPVYVLLDSWQAGLDNLKRLRSYGWHWLTRLKHNRLVNPEGSGNVPIEQVDIPAEGRVVHLKGYGFIKVFRRVATDGDAQYWVTDDLAMMQAQRQVLEHQSWAIEAYHRGLKQCCGVERAQVRKADEQKRHIFLSVRAFVRLEAHRLRTGLSWYEAKTAIVREAIRQYLAHPIIQLNPTA